MSFENPKPPKDESPEEKLKKETNRAKAIGAGLFVALGAQVAHEVSNSDDLGVENTYNIAEAADVYRAKTGTEAAGQQFIDPKSGRTFVISPASEKHTLNPVSSEKHMIDPTARIEEDGQTH